MCVAVVTVLMSPMCSPVLVCKCVSVSDSNYRAGLGSHTGASDLCLYSRCLMHLFVISLSSRCVFMYVCAHLTTQQPYYTTVPSCKHLDENWFRRWASLNLYPPVKVLKWFLECTVKHLHANWFEHIFIFLDLLQAMLCRYRYITGSSHRIV